MNTFHTVIRTAGNIAALALLALAFTTQAATPRPIGGDFDPEVGALVHKEKARQRALNKADQNKQWQAGEDGCGTISINSNNQPQNNFRPGKPNVTVITGPVVNAANCR